MFLFTHTLPNISRKSTKLHFQRRRKGSSAISLCFRKMTAKLSRNSSSANNIRLEHFLDIFLIPQIWLSQSLPAFMFVYVHFNVPPTRITDFGGNVSHHILTSARVPLSVLFANLYFSRNRSSIGCPKKVLIKNKIE